MVVARTALGTLVLLPFALRGGAWRMLHRHWRAVLLLTAVEVTLPFALITYGEQRITSSLAGLLVATLPLLVALAGPWAGSPERVTGTRLAGMLLGFVGVALLLGVDVSGDPRQLVGAALVLLATVSYTGGVLTVQRAFADTPMLPVAAATLALNTVVMAPVAAFRLPAQVPSAAALASLAGLGVACSAIAFVAYFALIAEAGASRATVITYLNPAVAVALGVLVLSEPITAALAAGFLLIIVGSWLSTGGTLPPRVAAAALARARRREVGRLEADRTAGAAGMPGRPVPAPRMLHVVWQCWHC